jgi:protein-tyrosine phosphatase
MTSHYTSQSSNQSNISHMGQQKKTINTRLESIKQNLPLLIVNKKPNSDYSLFNQFNQFDHNATPVIQENSCTIYLGAVEHSNDTKFLLHNNIQTIVCVTVEEPHLKNDPNMSHITFLHIPLLDSCNETIHDHFVTFSDFIEEQIKLGKSTLVHCHMGISRSATLLCSYLISKKNMTARESINFLRDKRPQVEPNVGFCFRLDGFEQVMKK